MFVFKKLYCRLFQLGFRSAMPFLPYRNPEIIKYISKTGEILVSENKRSVLIVTDKGVIKNGLLNELEISLKNSGIKYVIYDETQPNPSVENVEKALSVYLENNCEALIGIGGGSSMDCAKVVGARLAYPKKPVSKLGGKLKVRRKLPLLIAIPTTAGTGSEATLAAIITEPGKKHKYALMSFPLIPRYAVLDANLTRTLPPHLTASTGIDALTHAIEAWIGKSTTKETRKLSADAVRLVFENVKNAYDDGDNLTARKNMLLASHKAGLAFSKSYVGYVHGVAHSLGGQYGIPHGLANAVVLPYVLEAYGEKIHKKLNRLGMLSGICDGSENDKEGAEKFIEAVKKLNESLGIPKKLKGIRKEDIEIMAYHAEKESNPLYPVPLLMTRKELEVFYYDVADWSEQNERI